MNRDELIETVQRLLALSSSSNEHESAAALARANELMAKYNISMFDVEQQKASAEYCTDDVYEGGRSLVTTPYIYPILEKYFFVKALNTRGYRKVTLQFFGDKHNVEIAKYIFHYLDRLYHELADHNRIRASHRQAYYSGLQSGLMDKLKKERESLNSQSGSQNALICLDKQLTVAFHNRFPRLRQKTRYSQISQNDHAYNLGIKDGAEISLHQGLTGSENKRLN